MNHYELALNDLIEHIKADKSIVQPWRNDAIANMRRAVAFIDKGLTTAPAHLVQTAERDGQPVMSLCTCPPGGRRKDCPVHRELS
jgi:hypothetical protein